MRNWTSSFLAVTLTLFTSLNAQSSHQDLSHKYPCMYQWSATATGLYWRPSYPHPYNVAYLYGGKKGGIFSLSKTKCNYICPTHHVGLALQLDRFFCSQRAFVRLNWTHLYTKDTLQVTSREKRLALYWQLRPLGAIYERARGSEQIHYDKVGVSLGIRLRSSRGEFSPYVTAQGLFLRNLRQSRAWDNDRSTAKNSYTLLEHFYGGAIGVGCEGTYRLLGSLSLVSRLKGVLGVGQYGYDERYALVSENYFQSDRQRDAESFINVEIQAGLRYAWRWRTLLLHAEAGYSVDTTMTIVALFPFHQRSLSAISFEGPYAALKARF